MSWLSKRRDNKLRQAAWNGDARKISRLLKTRKMSTAGRDWALVWAAEKGHAETVKVLHHAGADLHAWSGAPLYRAACNGHVDVVRYLVGQGAWDDLALQSAEYFGHTETAGLLHRAQRERDALQSRMRLPLTQVDRAVIAELLREAEEEQASPGRPRRGDYAPLPDVWKHIVCSP